MDKVKIAVIGVGGIGGSHLACIDRAENAQLVAVCDIIKDRADETAAKWDVDAYYTHEELLEKADVDAITIGTPHYDHTPIAIHGLDAGKHVLTEKPIAVHVNDARKMIEAAERNPEQVFSAMFQLRVNPMWQRAKKLIDEGELGTITRITWTVTTWFRSQTYYDSGGWRATWSGEGGGVLLNQCPHNLDILQWLGGLPETVLAHVAIGKDHHIEVEDEVIAILTYPGGATGTFITNTSEAPGSNRLEIAGDRGILVVEDGTLNFRRTTVSVKEFLKTTDTRFGIPEVWD
ncbi:MAG: Gfo/Idh/MocA family protein, partial [Planctomycetota bacterium]